MATLISTSDTLHLRLTPGEKLAAFTTGDVEIPCDQVRSVTTAADPFSAIRGIRAPGLAWPRTVAIGKWRHRGGTDFVVVRRGAPAVVVELDDRAPYRRLVVGAADAEAVAERLSA